METRLIDDAPAAVASCRPEDVRVERLSSPGPLLESGYQLFQRVFDPAILDPFDVNVRRLTPQGRAERDYVPCFSIAYVDHGGARYVAGMLAGDLMQTEGSGSVSFLAIGNMAAAASLRQRGVRGIGTRLLDCALAAARTEAATNGVQVSYAVAEAEPASLGFWRKCGFRRPQSVSYVQPPLEFHADGWPVYAETPETLVVAPIHADLNSMPSVVLQQMIATLYRNWCLRGREETLSPAAFKRAEAYVMQHVFDRVVATLPAGVVELSPEY